jgi:hypothetical protein
MQVVRVHLFSRTVSYVHHMDERTPDDKKDTVQVRTFSIEKLSNRFWEIAVFAGETATRGIFGQSINCIAKAV